MNMQTCCVIQCTADDIYESDYDPNNYVIAPAREVFDDVVIACPDKPESRELEKLGVRVHYGPEWDVVSRILGATDADIIGRVLLRRNYMDVELVRSMIEMLRLNDADYITLPRDFNYELGADVFRRNALVELNNYIPVFTGEGLSNKEAFSPWNRLEHSPWSALIHPGCIYTPERVKQVKSMVRVSENQFNSGGSPISCYQKVIPFLGELKRKQLKDYPTGPCVLDLACGSGAGTIEMAKELACSDGFVRCSVKGVDINENAIWYAEELAYVKHNLSPTLIEFLVDDVHEHRGGDKSGYLISKWNYDVITSMHTLEHLDNPPQFLKRCHELLGLNGKLFIEVPILLPRPLGEPLYPFHKWEPTRAELETMLTDAGFKIVKAWGRNRNIYTHINNAREAVQYLCTK